MTVYNQPKHAQFLFVNHTSRRLEKRMSKHGSALPPHLPGESQNLRSPALKMPSLLPFCSGLFPFLPSPLLCICSGLGSIPSLPPSPQASAGQRVESRQRVWHAATGLSVLRALICLSTLTLWKEKGVKLSQMLREALRSPVFGHLFPGLCFHSPVVCNVIYYRKLIWIRWTKLLLQATCQNTDENVPGVLLWARLN